MAKGIDVRQSTDRLQLRVFLLDSIGAVVTSGTANLYIFELQDDGTLKTYDWNDNTFKTTTVTTATDTFTYRMGNNNGVHTGLWTKVLTTLTGFTVGRIYFAMSNHSNAYPTTQIREFQFGDEQGDGLNAIADAILKRDWSAVTGEAARSMLNALRHIRNKWAIAGGTKTVYKEDDSTSAWTSTVTGDGAAQPIVADDPA
jgi:hypothetical protein